MENKDNRPTFYFNKKPIRAGGVLFYYRDPLTNNIKMLLQYSEKNKFNTKKYVYEDIGGKTDEIDTCINGTIIRETIEETNGVISKELITEYLSKENKVVYLDNSKYYLVLIKVDYDINQNIINIDRRLFGKEESSSNKKRQFFWIDSNRLRFGGIPFNERLWLCRKQILTLL
jgi:hypothetical protein